MRIKKKLSEKCIYFTFLLMNRLAGYRTSFPHSMSSFPPLYFNLCFTVNLYGGLTLDLLMGICFLSTISGVFHTPHIHIWKGLSLCFCAGLSLKLSGFMSHLSLEVFPVTPYDKLPAATSL